MQLGSVTLKINNQQRESHRRPGGHRATPPGGPTRSRRCQAEPSPRARALQPEDSSSVRQTYPDPSPVVPVPLAESITAQGHGISPTGPHRPWLRLVVPNSRSTCPPLSPSPHANSFVIGTAVINTHAACHVSDSLASCPDKPVPEPAAHQSSQLS